MFAELPCSSAPVLVYSAHGSILSFWVINCEKTRKLLHKRWLTDPVRSSAEIHMLVLALYWATLAPAYFSFDTFQGIGNLGNDSSSSMQYNFQHLLVKLKLLPTNHELLC